MSDRSAARASISEERPARGNVHQPADALPLILLAAVVMTALVASAVADGASLGAAATAETPPAWRSPDAWLRVAGRLHPLLVHFPIALILAAAMIEVFRAAIRRGPSRTAVTMLAFGLLGAAAAIASGWLNGDFEPRGSQAATMELHRWFAIAGGGVALLAVPLGAVALRSTRAGRSTIAFRGTLLVAAGVIGFAAHLGGSMVYGDGYLLAPLSMSRASSVEAPAIVGSDVDLRPGPGTPTIDPVPLGAALPVEPAGATWRESDLRFTRDVLPILEANCIECHGAGRARASLRLDALEHVLGAEPWVLALDDPASSDLVDRVKRSVDDEGAMPPKGPRLTASQVATIEAWIAAHVAGEARPKSASGPDAASVVPDGQAGRSTGASSDRSQEWTSAQIEAIAFFRARGASIEPVAFGSRLLDVNLALMSPPCDATEFERLAPLLPVTQRLDLAGAGLGDEFASLLSDSPPLQFLDLDRTRLDDRAAGALASLPELETLILTNTSLSDAGLVSLARSPSLRTIYAAGSKVTAAGVAATGSAPSVVLAAPTRPMIVHLIRHAEKQENGDDASLTEAGAARAAALVGALAGEPIRMIIVTQFARTKETAEPIAKVLGVTPTVIEAGRDLETHVSAVIGAIRTLPRGSTVLVVGHSNTVPAIAKALGVADAIVVEEDTYGDLFTVRLDDTAATLHRRESFATKE